MAHATNRTVGGFERPIRVNVPRYTKGTLARYECPMV